MIDSHDFETVFRAHYTRLYYFAYDFTGEAEASRDIVSEAFSRLWEARLRVEPGSVESLLFITVRNLCANMLRKRKTSSRYVRYVRASERGGRCLPATDGQPHRGDAAGGGEDAGAHQAGAGDVLLREHDI